MTLWSIHPRDTSRISLVAFVAMAVMISVFALHQKAALTTATISDVHTIDPTLLPVADETFVTPRSITWDGRITRIFVSGSGLEVAGPDIPGGVFQAYMPGDQISPITSGQVRIEGFWYGYTCAYGGHQPGLTGRTGAGSCVPDVQIQSIESK